MQSKISVKYISMTKVYELLENISSEICGFGKNGEM